MNRICLAAGLGLAVLVAVGCDETVPTSTDPSLLPVAPTTVAVDLTFSEFGRDLTVVTGFGSAAELNQAIVAHEFDEALDARAVVRFAAFPEAVAVAGPDGVVVTDSTVTYAGGRVVVHVDSASAVLEAPVLLRASALEGPRWDEESLNWTMAVDTVADNVPWPEPGAGPARELDAVVWDPEAGDSVVFQVDSAALAVWADTSDASRGLRLDTPDAGVRLEFSVIQLNVDVRPSVRPDTLVERTVIPESRDFVYAPPPPPTQGELRVGGAPSWRSTFGVQLPDTLHGPPELCEALGCPFELRAESVNFASLTLRTGTSPPGFLPDDTLAMDVRTVLSESDLPKSPLGSSYAPLLGVRVTPDAFRDDPGQETTVGVTTFVQDLLRGETLRGDPAPRALSLLSFFEPLALEVMTFEGFGPSEPTLRMILTTRVGVPLR